MHIAHQRKYRMSSESHKFHFISTRKIPIYSDTGKNIRMNGFDFEVHHHQKMH